MDSIKFCTIVSENVHNDSGICDNDSSPKSDGELSDLNQGKFVFGNNLQSANLHKNTSNSSSNRSSVLSQTNEEISSNSDRVSPRKGAAFSTQRQQDQRNGATLPPRRIPPPPVPPRASTQTDVSARKPVLATTNGYHPVPVTNCTNDSCTEDVKVDGSAHNVSHTPSCPYHICTSCNGVVPPEKLQKIQEKELEEQQSIDMQKLFYSKCLSAKLRPSRNLKGKSNHISELYKKSKELKIPVDKWDDFISKEMNAKLIGFGLVNI